MGVSVRLAAEAVTLEVPARGRAAGRAVRGRRRRLVVRALDSVSLDLGPGDRLAVTGLPGSGKTLLLRVLAGAVDPSGGRVWRSGRVRLVPRALLGGTGTGYEELIAHGLALGVAPARIRAHLDEILEFAEFGSSLALPAMSYPASVRARLAFAVATCEAPDVLLVDDWPPSGRGAERLAARFERVAAQAAIVVTAGAEAPPGAAGLRLEEGRPAASGPLPAVRVGSAAPGPALPALSPDAPASVVMAVCDEDPAEVAAAVAAALAQDHRGALEVVVADGSAGGPRAVPGARVVANPAGTAAAGLNRAAAAAAHPVLVRCDARARLPRDYVRRAVATLVRTGAAVVGGRQRAVGRTFFERAVALAATTPLGAGRARYRVGGAEGPVDTVYLGVFRRDAFERAGGYDESLGRNQDYELNWRLRAVGGQVWFDPALGARYTPRGSLAALARQYYDYGRWKRHVLGRDPASLRARQLGPPALVAGLAASAALAVCGGPALAAAAVPASYAAVLGAGALAVGAWRRDPAALAMPLALATMHLSWGAGFLCGRVRPVPPAAPAAVGSEAARQRANGAQVNGVAARAGGHDAPGADG